MKINIGHARKHADLVVFKNGAEHTQDEALIEAKRAEEKLSDNTHGEGQLTSHMVVPSYGRTLETWQIDRTGMLGYSSNARA